MDLKHPSYGENYKKTLIFLRHFTFYIDLKVVKCLDSVPSFLAGNCLDLVCTC